MEDQRSTKQKEPNEVNNNQLKQKDFFDKILKFMQESFFVFWSIILLLYVWETWNLQLY